MNSSKLLAELITFGHYLISVTQTVILVMPIEIATHNALQHHFGVFITISENVNFRTKWKTHRRIKTKSGALFSGFCMCLDKCIGY